MVQLRLLPPVAGLHPDAPTTTLTAHRSADAIPALGESGAPAKALLLHMHNGTGDLSGTNGAKGNRAEVLNTRSSRPSTSLRPASPM